MFPSHRWRLRGRDDTGDASRLRWLRFHGLSPEIKANIDGRLIDDHRDLIESRLRAAFCFGRDFR
jgi:hypothetical protein